MPRPVISYTGRQCCACLRVEKTTWVPYRFCECGHNWTDTPSELLDVCEMAAHEMNGRINQVLKLAYDRGQRGSTFATYEERATPGYDTAWTDGKNDPLPSDDPYGNYTPRY